MDPSPLHSSQLKDSIQGAPLGPPAGIDGLPNLGKRQIHVVNGLIDLLGALESDRNSFHTCILKSETHRLHTVVMAILELTSTAQLHPDHAKSVFQIGRAHV